MSSGGPTTADLARMLMTGNIGGTSGALALLDLDDPATVRGLVAQRLRAGPIDLFEHAIVFALLPALGTDATVPLLEQLARDGTLAPSSRACALLGLGACGATHFTLDLRAEPPERAAALMSAKLTAEIGFQFPAIGLSAGLAKFVAEVPPELHAARFAEIDTCRRAAGVPAALALHAVPVHPALGALRRRALDAIVAEGHAGARIVLERAANRAPDAAARLAIDEAVTALRAKPELPTPDAAPRGRCVIVEAPNGHSQGMYCVRLPSAITLVSEVFGEPDGSVRVSQLAIMPGTPAMDASGKDVVIHDVGVREGAERFVPRALAMHERGGPLAWEIAVLACAMDGVPGDSVAIAAEKKKAREAAAGPKKSAN